MSRRDEIFIEPASSWESLSPFMGGTDVAPKGASAFNRIARAINISSLRDRDDCALPAAQPLTN